ncbi:MAG: glycosyltransferase [Candidatus Omnitrophica bacterium]|nr:glycosyltransferase [Candidatus Omnitrophota bacterium]
MQNQNIKLSIIIPVYNEINTILEIIKLVKEEPHKKEIIIVDDASTDGTKELLLNINQPDIKVLFNQKNKGKGYCIRKAINYVTADIVIIQDADLEYYPNEYGRIIRKIIEGKADVVYGSRFLGGERRVFYFYHYLGNKLLNLVVNIFLNSNFTDLMTCYKAFRSDVLKSLKLAANRFGIEVELTVEVFKRKYRVYEVPISYDGRSYDEGKKIKWTDFFSCLYWLFKSLFRTLDLGEETLLRIRLLKKNNRWIFKKTKPFLGKKILELGCGIGTFSRFLISKDTFVVLTDINKRYTDYLKKVFIGNPFVEIKNIDILEIDKFWQDNFDTVICLNVVEHIQDDIALFKKINKVLNKSGKIICLAPAHKILFSNFDKNLGHFRRYTKKELIEKLENCGFKIKKIEFINSLGAILWFINFKLLKAKKINFAARFFDFIVPLISFLEKRIKFCFGLSLFCVATKEKDLS